MLPGAIKGFEPVDKLEKKGDGKWKILSRDGTISLYDENTAEVKKTDVKGEEKETEQEKADIALQKQKDFFDYKEQNKSEGKELTEAQKKALIAKHISRITTLSKTKGFSALDIAMGGDKIIEQMKSGLSDEGKQEVEWLQSEVKQLQGSLTGEKSKYFNDSKEKGWEQYLKDNPTLPNTPDNQKYYMENF